MASKATPDDNFKLLLSGIDGLHVGAVQTNNDAHVLPNFTVPFVKLKKNIITTLALYCIITIIC